MRGFFVISVLKAETISGAVAHCAAISRLFATSRDAVLFFNTWTTDRQWGWRIPGTNRKGLSVNDLQRAVSRVFLPHSLGATTFDTRGRGRFACDLPRILRRANVLGIGREIARPDATVL